MSKLTLKTEGDKHVVVTRRFAAPPEVVYRAHTEPKLVQKWMLGPDGWTMPVCVCEARPGDKIRYEWADGKGGDPNPCPDNHVETRFEPDGNGTLMTMRMTLPDAQTRKPMLASGMEHGMEASYVRLETIN